MPAKKERVQKKEMHRQSSEPKSEGKRRSSSTETKPSKKTTNTKKTTDTSQPELINPEQIMFNQEQTSQSKSKNSSGGLPAGTKPKAIIKQASVLSRALAFIFDLLLIDLVIFSWFRKYFINLAPADASLGSLLASTSQASSSLSPHLSLVITIMMLLMMAYFIFFEFMFSQTPGKLLFRLKSISSSQLLQRVQKQQSTMEDIREKVINSEQTVDIQQEMKKRVQQDPDFSTGVSFSLTFWQALLRWIVFIPFLPFNLLLFIDPIYLLIRRQRLTEVISKTTVVEIIPTSFPYAQKLIERLQNKNKNR